ncbi:cytochrome P450 [Nocardia macrotermitis]|uniref:1,8-cineole 2-endo-monooxygenase n=1 Tax=Nocardia macrotermitis TaxID=2585198 RepID=A0A7K0D9G5_9NOCA|nr:cytochrome P450 [Nocardia macrotermitis]MQY21494.1 1,8-cineole 2-endo-monooxygenase [Nocardia macrotermitis]
MSTPVDSDSTYEGVPAYDFDNRTPGPVLSHQQHWDRMAASHNGFRSTVASGFWVVTDGPAIQRALQDWRTFSNTSVTALNPDPQFLWIPEMLDPPVHTKWRRLLGADFSPKTAANSEAEVRELAIELIDELSGRGSADVLGEFTRRFPTKVVMRLLGLPEQDLDTFLGWVHEILHLTHEQDPDGSRQLAAIAEVSAYFEEQITARREQPRDDLISRAMTWSIDGEQISHGDLHALCLLLFQAGFDTVPITLGWTFYHFATHPEQRREIVADPSLIGTAVEEILRVYSPVIPARKAVRDTEVGGCPVKSGEMVMLPLSVTNRDPERYENPLEVDLHRTNTDHVAFGSGPHRCLGSHLARLELNVAVQEWHKRIPDYRLAPGQDLQETGNMYGLTSLRLEW